ncbi:MAG: GrpB family protein [Chloroflexota bacterium]|nr:GrpB family protein [Chloroflexota bacterium]
MAAKAIVDMVAVVHTMDGLEAAVDALRALGWVHAPEPDQAQLFRSFCTPSIATRTHHLHVFEQSSDGWRCLLAFRDYLRAHPGLAAAYAALKRELASQHGSDPNRREPYRVGKAQFIQEVTALARGSSSS